METSQGRIASAESDLVMRGTPLTPNDTSAAGELKINAEPELTILMLHAMEEALGDRLHYRDHEKYEIFERAYDWVTLQIEKRERESCG